MCDEGWRIIGLLSIGLLALSLVSQNAPLLASNKVATKFVANHVRTGTFVYRQLNHGYEIGRSRITIRQLPALRLVTFVGDTTFRDEPHGFSGQHWETITTPTLEPISAMLSYVHGFRVIPAYEMRYDAGRITGFFASDGDFVAGTRKQLQARVPSRTIDERIGWAGVLASGIRPGANFRFSIYNPNTGISHVNGQVLGTQNISVPAGRFQAYRIAYQVQNRGKAVCHVMFATRESPHILLRDEHENSAGYEIVQISGSAQ